MLRALLVAGLLHCLVISLYAQCWDQQNKIIPDRHLSKSNQFGASVAIAGDFMAVGDAWHDTLAHYGGAVFLYQRQADTWTQVATLLPSDPVERGFFGQTIALTNNYLFVGSPAKSHIYVYAREGQWRGGIEDHTIVAPEESLYFGNMLYTSPDESTLFVGDTQTREGIVYKYLQPAGGWTAVSSPINSFEPPTDASDLGPSQQFGDALALTDKLLVVGAPGGLGRAYVYQFDETVNDWQLRGQLRSSLPSGYSSGFGDRVLIMHGSILIQSSFSGSNRIFQFMPRPEWHDAQADTAYYIGDPARREYTQLTATYDSSLVVLGSGPDDQLNAYSFHLTDTHLLEPQPTQTLYSRTNFPYFPGSLAADEQGTLAIGYATEPHAPRQVGEVWLVPRVNKQWDYTQRSKVTYPYFSASDDLFGHTLLRTNDYLFVGAPGDRRTLNATGAVHLYKQEVTGWRKVHEWLADTVKGFGRSLQFQRDTLYIGSNTTIRCFKKGSLDEDWVPLSSISPPDSVNVLIFGSQFRVKGSLMAVMGLVATNKGKEIAVFLFEKANSSWRYQTFVSLGDASIIGHNYDRGVDIYHQTVLAVAQHGHIIERNSTGQWSITTTLAVGANRVAHPESAILLEDKAFIGVPHDGSLSDYSSGAVYMFRRGGETWQAPHEHQKILPSDANSMAYFGKSLALQGDVLVVGAPGKATTHNIFEDWYGYYNPHRVFGSVYVFRAADTQWNQIVEVAKLRSDQKTLGDQYGAAVALKNGELTVGSLTEDSRYGKRSGSVYTNAFPQLLATKVKLDGASERYLCDSNASFLLTVSPEVADETYQWYRMTEGKSQSVVAVGGDSVRLRIHHPGKYWVVVGNEGCQQTSDTVTVHQTMPPAFHFPGTHPPSLCRATPILRIANYSPKYTYQLHRLDDQPSGAESISLTQSETVIQQPGTYRVSTFVGKCYWHSDTFKVQAIDTAFTVIPTVRRLDVCASEQLLEVTRKEGVQYTWYYSFREGIAPVVVGHHHQFVANKTGHYQVIAQSGQCKWTSPRTYVKFHKPVVLDKVANVFTPNGDQTNDTFFVPISEVLYYDLTIYNRYGKLLYQTHKPTDHWDGGNTPPGVYFWLLRYRDFCEQRFKTIRGQVSIIKVKTY